MATETFNSDSHIYAEETETFNSDSHIRLPYDITTFTSDSFVFVGIRTVFRYEDDMGNNRGRYYGGGNSSTGGTQ